MNVFILTDVEGIAGVTDIDFMDRTGEKYLLARQYLCHSINLAARTCFDCGAEVERVDARTLRKKVAGITRYEDLKF